MSDERPKKRVKKLTEYVYKKSNNLGSLKLLLKECSLWFKSLQEETSKSYFLDLERFVAEEYGSKTIYPKYANIFRALKLCPLDKVKVVILGQDPYHQKGQAIGLAFAIGKNIKPPPSLRNIHKELKNCFEDCPDLSSLDLSKWAEQGVLLLNTVLTVEHSKAFSHRKKGWEIFTNEIIRVVSQELKQVVFLLWGKPAEQKMELISNEHKIIKSSHPSPLSATRTNTPFIGSSCFAKVNKYLQDIGQKEIQWI